jgi:chromosome segregation ATPase
MSHWIPTRASALVFILCLLIPLSLLADTQQAQAGMMDRIKGIYEAPEQLEQMREQYTELKTTYEEQQKKTEAALQASRVEAERLAKEQRQWLAENEKVRQENAALEAHNQQLMQRVELLEQQEASRTSLMDRILKITITAILLLVGYFLAVRIFRYIIWRNGRKSEPVTRP